MARQRGRHFYKCERRLCDCFAWDPVERRNSEEVEKMKEEMSEAMKQVKLREEKLRAREKDLMEELHEKEEALRTSQLQLNQSAQGMVESVMAHADQKHGELMQGQRFQHSDGDGDHAEPTTMDDGSSWGGQDKPGAQRSTTTCRVDEEGTGDQAGHDADSGTLARAGGVSCRRYFRDLTVEEMEELRRVGPWACT